MKCGGYVGRAHGEALKSYMQRGSPKTIWQNMKMTPSVQSPVSAKERGIARDVDALLMPLSSQQSGICFVPLHGVGTIQINMHSM